MITNLLIFQKEPFKTTSPAWRLGTIKTAWAVFPLSDYSDWVSTHPTRFYEVT